MKKKGGKIRVRKKGSYKRTLRLSDTKPEFYFKLINGKSIKNILGLADDLDKIPDEVLYHHVNPQRNDFSNWLRDIFKQKKLADEISKVQSRLEIQVILLKFIVKQLKRLR
ncbi:MAG: hypothetical protein AABX32_03480 [Nanoarchaeota archaeon]